MAAPAKKCDGACANSDLPFFRDYGKASKDLMEKGFPDTKKFVLKTATDGGISFETTLDSKNGSIVATVKPKYVCTKTNSELTLTVDSVSQLSGELLHKRPAQNLRLTAKHSVADRKSSLLVDFTHSRGNVSLETALDKGATKVTLATLFGSNCWTGGFNAVYPVSGAKLASATVVAGSCRGKYNTLVSADYSEQTGTKLNARVMYTANPSTKFVVATGLDVVNFVPDAKTTRVAVAGSYKMDDTLTMQGRVCSTGRLRTSAAMQLSKSVKLTLAGEVDVQQQTLTNKGFELTVDM